VAILVTVRPARDDDRRFVFDTTGRLSSFGPPEWRSGGEIVEGERRTLREHFDGRTDSCILLIAEDSGGERLGFAFVEEVHDYFTLERHGHIGILAVAAEAEGRGAAKALIAAAESWTRNRSMSRLTLNVFEANAHARQVYEHVGFRPGTIKYTKTL
jgi:GNAT superfamily N-acetyltransferase